MKVGLIDVDGHNFPSLELYEWLLSLFAKSGDVILDTHVGSASSLIACHKMRYKFIGFEKDKHYYELSSKRLKMEQAQMSIFDFMERGGKQNE